MFDREKQTIGKPDKSLTTFQACKIFTAAKLISVTFATQVCGTLVRQHKQKDLSCCRWNFLFGQPGSK